MSYKADPRQVNYTACTVEDVMRHIVEDDLGVIRQIFLSNSLPRWRSNPEYLSDYKSNLALYLLSRKFSGDTSALVPFFNAASWNGWLVVYTRNQCQSNSSRFAKENSLRSDTVFVDDEVPEMEAPTRDEPYEMGEHLRDVKLWDPDVISWRLRHPYFSAITITQREVYLRYLGEGLVSGRKPNLIEFSKRHKLRYRPTLDLINRVNKMMTTRVNEIERMLKDTR